MVRTARKVAALAALMLPLLALTMAGAAGAAPARGTTLSADGAAPVMARPVETVSVRVSKPALFAVSFADLKFGWAVGSQGAIFRTRDGGHHWVRQYVHGPWLLDPRVFTSVKAVSSKVCWVVGGAIYRTTDGGKSWTRMAKKLRPVSLTGNQWQDVVFPTNKAARWCPLVATSSTPSTAA